MSCEETSSSLLETLLKSMLLPPVHLVGPTNHGLVVAEGADVVGDWFKDALTFIVKLAACEELEPRKVLHPSTDEEGQEDGGMPAAVLRALFKIRPACVENDASTTSNYLSSTMLAPLCVRTYFEFACEWVARTHTTDKLNTARAIRQELEAVQVK
jgi:hypothetical protein